MNRIYKLVLGVKVSVRSGSVPSISVRINVITDIKYFVQALRVGCSDRGLGGSGLGTSSSCPCLLA
jgi:hypothetical protein